MHLRSEHTRIFSEQGSSTLSRAKSADFVKGATLLNMDLAQQIADQLLAMEKEFTTSDPINLHSGAKFIRELASTNGQEQFLLDFYQGTIRLNKVTSNHRYARTIILARLDLNGSPHMNPDGQVIHGSHLHLYREGYGDKWASLLDATVFTDAADPALSLRQFLGFLNVQNIPAIQALLI